MLYRRTQISNLYAWKQLRAFRWDGALLLHVRHGSGSSGDFAMALKLRLRCCTVGDRWRVFAGVGLWKNVVEMINRLWSAFGGRASAGVTQRAPEGAFRC